MSRRVVITGMGVISPVGVGLNRYWDNLKSGYSGIVPVTKFDTSDCPVKIGGEVPSDFNPEDFLDKKEIKRLDNFSIYALIAAEEAIRHAGLEEGIPDMDRFGVVVGSGVGGLLTMEEQNKRLLNRGFRGVSPLFIPMYILDIAAGHISMKWGLKGPNYAVVSACATGSTAIGDALRHIQYGDADIFIAGGTEACITPIAYAGFANMRALSRRNDEPEKASRPFDSDRDGFVMGEGAGLLVLEELEHAHNRGAKIHAELIGYGATADAYHITAPAPGGEGAMRAMKRAVKDGGVEPEDVDYINAHGTSTPFNDKNESLAIKTLFGEHAYKLNVSSTKSMTGHLLGAAGGIEAIAAIMAIKKNVIPPTINYDTPDPECDLNYTPNSAVDKSVSIAMSNTFGFGGHNAVLLFKEWSN
ncbi:MAG TPA: beta-ketoacyl-[acyl-carrier-protein] synthase II [Candidatus Marinimicrobia bacterium]|nr:beta-ketoacyl-[acyl-carrier-protein] synthase II [Candidatus Neomarinimicrobiota bacterium]HIA86624.1 beta-ketoacyl-[acyl-carrier-protein] synthase II [Candidatus Neomarinimicrobiota bacterium]HIB57768.1 beta-ketoacyl-[acyl-carrier-protein] synthase II [Candidatus Neomarinimicrobiota bacterium]HIN46533.1 beta-ketoacyl-[acyl-carrier-protein] synthase II [Candidatus Neomarinimicrobiota bacterium]